MLTSQKSNGTRGSPLRSRAGAGRSVSPHTNQLGGFRSTHLRNTSISDIAAPADNDYMESNMRRDPALAGSYGQPLQFYPSRISRRELVEPAPLYRPEIIEQPRLRQRSIGKSAEKHLGPNVTEIPLSQTHSRVALSRHEEIGERSRSPYDRPSRNRASPLRSKSPLHENSFMRDTKRTNHGLMSSGMRSKSREKSSEKIDKFMRPYPVAF